MEEDELRSPWGGIRRCRFGAVTITAKRCYFSPVIDKTHTNLMTVTCAIKADDFIRLFLIFRCSVSLSFPHPPFFSEQWGSETQTAVSTIIFRKIEMFAIGVRWAHNLWHSCVGRHATVVHAFIIMEWLFPPRESPLNCPLSGFERVQCPFFPQHWPLQRLSMIG